jgi:subtilisin family serine protease
MRRLAWLLALAAVGTPSRAAPDSVPTTPTAGGARSAGRPVGDTFRAPSSLAVETGAARLARLDAAPDAARRVDAHLRRAIRAGPGPWTALALDVEQTPAHVHAEARVGRVTAVRVADVDALVALARAAAAVTAPQPLSARASPTSLDASRVAIGAERFDGRDAALPRRSGRGVLVGAYDSGVDLGHPDLVTDGHVRVRRWIDDAARVTCTSTTIDAGACTLADRTGHGTHVLGVAVGRGVALRGVAPEAELLVVSSDRFEAFVPALAWLDAAARSEARPLVVNVSLGGHVGPHDGTSLEARAIDGYPRVVVVAAGNEGTLPVHARVTLDATTPKVAIPIVWPSDDVTARGWIDVWGAASSSVSAALELLDARGTQIASTPWIGPGAVGFASALDALSVALDAEPSGSPLNGRPHVAVALEGVRTRGLRLVLRLAGRGAVDAWIDTAATSGTLVRFAREAELAAPGEHAGDAAFSLSDLASSASAIAVSSWVAATAVDGASGRLGFTGTLDTISRFSSFGPTLAPAATGQKPDLAAPGQTVVSLGRAALGPAIGVAVTPLYRAAAGTSMAAPHVAGAAALVLEGEPALGRDALRARLVGATRLPPDDDPRWGRGPFDLPRAFGVDDAEGCQAAGARPGLGALALALALERLRHRRASARRRRTDLDAG